MISMDKKYRTRDGREVVLYCVDAPGKYPVHGRVAGDLPTGWTSAGFIFAGLFDEPRDLIEVQPERWQAHRWEKLSAGDYVLVRNLGEWRDYPSEAAARAASHHG